MPSGTSAVDLVGALYAALFLFVTVALTATSWGLYFLFDDRIDEVKPTDRRAYVTVCWGWMFSRVVWRVQAANCALFLFTVATPPLYTKFFISDLPEHWSGLLTLVGWLGILSLLSLSVPYLVRAKSSA